MKKSDFVKIGQSIYRATQVAPGKTAHDVAFAEMVVEIAETCSKDPEFNRGLFFGACGIASELLDEALKDH